MPDFAHEHGCGASLVCGVDEAGRGPLAGPVVAAAVIFPDFAQAPDGLDDSKRLTPERREILHDLIIVRAHVGIGVCDHEEVDLHNIFHATMLAMQRAVGALSPAPSMALVDGNVAPALACRAQPIVGGDGVSASIAAASIVAKVTRDRMMRGMDSRFPGYGFAAHKGYPTPAHKQAIRELGPCAIHRRSFRFVAEHLHLTRRAVAV